mgnify:CR=1 FL=1
MGIGDLVHFNPNSEGIRAGSLTAVKFFKRTKDRINGKLGVIIDFHGESCLVMFGNDIIVLNRSFLEVVGNGTKITK